MEIKQTSPPVIEPGHTYASISAMLLLQQQKWRTSINHFAEALTLFAVLTPSVTDYKSNSMVIAMADPLC